MRLCRPGDRRDGTGHGHGTNLSACRPVSGAWDTRICPDMPWEPREGFHALADHYGALEWHGTSISAAT